MTRNVLCAATGLHRLHPGGGSFPCRANLREKCAVEGDPIFWFFFFFFLTEWVIPPKDAKNRPFLRITRRFGRLLVTTRLPFSTGFTGEMGSLNSDPMRTS